MPKNFAGKCFDISDLNALIVGLKAAKETLVKYRNIEIFRFFILPQTCDFCSFANVTSVLLPTN